MADGKKNNQPIPALPIDYLVIGHVTADLTQHGIRLGGTAAFSGLTAKTLGMNTGLITSFSDDLDLTPIESLWTKNKPSHNSTTFKNISDGVSRKQYLYHVAEQLTKDDLPTLKHPPRIVHLGPVANEVDQDIIELFPESLKCLTPQGWMRTTNSEKEVIRCPWEGYIDTIQYADVTVISQEDVEMDENIIAKMANLASILVVTENKRGARVYWHNDARFLNAPEVKYVDDTGAGDIFAAAFFYRYYFTRDPWEAGRFAIMLASWSVTRAHLESIPTPEEISQAKIELISH